MGKTYRAFTISFKSRPNDPAGTEKTWDVLYRLAALVQYKESFRNYPRLELIKTEEVHQDGLPR